jgi:hypothetical protein
MSKSLLNDNHLGEPAGHPALVAIAESSSIPHYPISAILGDQREAILIHNGDAYRLRITANNKLILTK